MSVEHLSMVLVLTVLQKADAPVSMTNLCTLANGSREDVERYVFELQRLGKVVWDGDRVELTQFHDGREEAMAYALRGYWGMGLAPRDDPGGDWERLPTAGKQRWYVHARQVLHSVDVLTAVEVARSPDKPVYWRGSVRDVVTDLAELMTVEQLQTLAGEAALAWRQRTLAERKPTAANPDLTPKEEGLKLQALLAMDRTSRGAVGVFEQVVKASAPICHVLLGGRALCCKVQGVPSEWGPGHIWDYGEIPERITCPDCRKVVDAGRRHHRVATWSGLEGDSVQGLCQTVRYSDGTVDRTKVFACERCNRFVVDATLAREEHAAVCPAREPPQCTGVAAVWCPIHGDCKCPRTETGERLEQDNDGCPLHAFSSTHGDEELDELEEEQDRQRGDEAITRAIERIIARESERGHAYKCQRCGAEWSQRKGTGCMSPGTLQTGSGALFAEHDWGFELKVPASLHVCSRDLTKGDSLAPPSRCGRPEEYRAKDPFLPVEAYLCGVCWSKLPLVQQANYTRTSGGKR